MRRNIRLLLQYDGSNYHGWQVQPNALTIQEVIETTVRRIVSRPVRILAAGRTDAGVHAWGQVANFHTDTSIPSGKLKKSLNSLLPDDIKVRALSEEAPSFESRKSARSKIYRYFILNRPEPSPWFFRYSWHYSRLLDCESIARAAKWLVGEMDFSSFQASDCDARSSVRKISRFEVHSRSGMITFTVEGNGFLKHMVRSMVGTLVEVGKGSMKPDEVKEIIELHDRTQAGPNVPAKGLFLWKVVY